MKENLVLNKIKKNCGNQSTIGIAMKDYVVKKCNMIYYHLLPKIVSVLQGAGDGAVVRALASGQSQNKEEAHLWFMKRCGNDLYTWQTPEDESWEAMIIDYINLHNYVVGFPKLVNKREQFCIRADNMARVKHHAQAFNYSCLCDGR